MTQNRSPRPVSSPGAAPGRHAGAIQVLMNTMFVRHLIGVYRVFGGDPVAAIVLGEVAHHNLAPMVNAARKPSELSEALLALRESNWRESLLPTNAFSIAQATGIPRETVRRKIASLTRRGWMLKDAAGNLFVSPRASESFSAFHLERLHDLLETARAIEALLDDQPPAIPRPPKGHRSGRARPGIA
jgi:hypothetical protein